MVTAPSIVGTRGVGAHTGHPPFHAWCEAIDAILGAGTTKQTSPTLLERLYRAGLDAPAAARELHAAHATFSARVGQEADVQADADVEVSPSDADLVSFGFDPNTVVSPADRAAAVKAYNDARVGMARAQQGATLEKMSAGVGIAVTALMYSYPVGAAFLAAFWAGSLAALKGLQAVFGVAHGGLGQWTEWCGNTAPIDENDPNWWHAETGYASALQRYGRGADTPYTRNLIAGPSGYKLGWPHEPEMHGFGDVNERIAHVDPRAQAFARFAMPIAYRAYELAMNCRSWDKFGYANQPADLGRTEGGAGIANPFEIALTMWNSQHDGPAVGIQNVGFSRYGATLGVFPLAPDWFTLNIGPLKGATSFSQGPLRGLSPQSTHTSLHSVLAPLTPTAPAKQASPANKGTLLGAGAGAAAALWFLGLGPIVLVGAVAGAVIGHAIGGRAAAGAAAAKK